MGTFVLLKLRSAGLVLSQRFSRSSPLLVTRHARIFIIIHIFTLFFPGMVTVPCKYQSVCSTVWRVVLNQSMRSLTTSFRTPCSPDQRYFNPATSISEGHLKFFVVSLDEDCRSCYNGLPEFPAFGEIMGFSSICAHSRMIQDTVVSLILAIQL